jgi:RHS repeat-associated protein
MQRQRMLGLGWAAHGAAVRRTTMNKQQWIFVAALALFATFARAQTVEYIHTDALGSPVAVTNASGTVIERTVYEPYGAVINRPLTNGPGYTGHVADAVTGLNYMQQRYYDPQLGRFLSVDPVTPESSTGANFNRYWYANSNPYRYIDPDGRYGQGAGWKGKDREWRRFDGAQQREAARLERAAAKITRALETGKGLKGVTRSFERTFGKGSGTPENMAEVASILTSVAEALRDDGSNGYTVSLVSKTEMATLTKRSDATKVLAAGEVGGKAIYVNGDHAEFRNGRELGRATGHESTHNLGLRDQRFNGHGAYYTGEPEQQDAFDNLPSAQRLINPDHLMHFAR